MTPPRTPKKQRELLSFARSFAFATLTALTLCQIERAAFADGIYRNGIGARSMGMAGADVAWAEGPLSAIGINPAGLTSLKAPNLELSLAGAIPDGEFQNRNGDHGKIDNFLSLVPEAGFALPIGKGPVTLGLAVIPDAVMNADWHYNDIAGGLDGKTSYGRQEDLSRIIVVRSALGVGVALGPKWSVGASVGLIYNQNTLRAPYVFQTQPALRGVKTLLDLDTDGFGYSGNIGLIFKPCDHVQLGIAYTTKSTVQSEGTATGNANAQLLSLGPPFSGVRPDFKYNAEVFNKFPQMVSGGLSWQACKRCRVALQVDWIDWADAFDTLHVRIKNGNNSDLNAFVGSSSADDYIPLDWKDRFVYRGGVEFAATDNLTLRAGYSYGKSPVPNSTLTPLTAAISEHTFAAGAGYHWSRYTIDLAYQYDLPAEQTVGVSSLQSGEYSGSRVELGVHWIALSASVRF